MYNICTTDGDCMGSNVVGLNRLQIYTFLHTNVLVPHILLYTCTIYLICTNEMLRLSGMVVVVTSSSKHGKGEPSNTILLCKFAVHAFTPLKSSIKYVSPF